ncbi:calcium-binding protein [Ciceribacter sp. L1K23]|uniref:calcium-binding protein n=1 Tax=unclassified Ciceribacter TaxID=2628820 RepID=UPI001ABDEBDB|nr:MULTISPECIES: calcium-binding protein [unclassified Ciceribacter]MBO3759600.1 calcium-binding protein [Ciceribacter sp. L1K22]MBR0556243.1 calcium-binding protein [Ciceribacter sp. L1K23]
MALNVYGTSYSDIIDAYDYGADLNIYAYGGNDRIYIGSYGGFNYVSAGSGNDRVYNTFEGGNGIYLGDGADVYYGRGYSTASSYVDTINAGTGNDTIYAETYHSIYNGESGNDVFFSVGWANTFHGGSGTDTISYEIQDDDGDLRGYGVYVDLYKGFATATDKEDETLISIENAVGTGYGDTILGTDGANRLWGDGGSDVLRGYGGNDRLYGGSGNDTLSGGANNDLLVGGSGRDSLSGGSGSDAFIFTSLSDSRPGSQRDTITDFSRSQHDYIDLSAIDADTTRGGNQAFDFIGRSSFSGDAGELRFSGGVLFADVNGDGVSDFQIKVSGLTSMSSGDFIL